MRTLNTMKTKSIFGLFVTTIALALLLVGFASPVDAFADITELVINGVEIDDPDAEIDIAGFAGDLISVRTTFTATNTIEEVRVTARILGEPGSFVDTGEFAVINGSTYSRLLNVELPDDLDEALDEGLTMEVTIESDNDGIGDEQLVRLHVQRFSDSIRILAVESEDEVRAGDSVVIDVVVKNVGRQLSEDTFIRATIPALGVSKMVFVGDIDSEDESDPDLEDSVLGRIYLNVPRDAPAGVYDVEIEAFNDDASAVTSRKIVVIGSSADSDVISSGMSKSFAAGEEQVYLMTIVNADSRIKVFELVLEAANGLTVTLDESLVAVPAGSSKTVSLRAVAPENGNFNFAVNVLSEGELVEKQSFTANVEGESTTAAGNAAVVLTIILAIIFVVLLIVLIVLLTRKPEKSEDFGESYY